MARERLVYRSDEMTALMDRVQELMEANVIAMVVRHPTGAISVACPPNVSPEVIALLKSHDWENWQP